MKVSHYLVSKFGFATIMQLPKTKYISIYLYFLKKNPGDLQRLVLRRIDEIEKYTCIFSNFGPGFHALKVMYFLKWLLEK